MKTLLVLPLLFLLLLLSPGVVAGENDEPRDDIALALAVRRVKVIRDAECIVVAKVHEVHESPGIWCGVLATRQEVTYRVERTISGSPASGDIRVGHLLVSGSSLVSKDAPYLKPSVLYPGARFLLYLHKDGGKWLVQDESFGAEPIDAEKTPDPVRTELLRQILLLPDLQEYLHPREEGRVPVKVVLSEAMPLARELTVLGRRVEFLPAYLTRGAPHLAITGATIDDQQAVIRFAYEVEGVVGEARFAREDGRLRLMASKVAER